MCSQFAANHAPPLHLSLSETPTCTSTPSYCQLLLPRTTSCIIPWTPFICQVQPNDDPDLDLGSCSFKLPHSWKFVPPRNLQNGGNRLPKYRCIANFDCFSFVSLKQITTEDYVDPKKVTKANSILAILVEKIMSNSWSLTASRENDEQYLALLIRL